jgi:hypothetical protein
MSTAAFLVTLVVCAGAVAVWLDVRFPGLSPRSLVAVGGHVVAATLLNEVIGPPVLRSVATLALPGAHQFAVLALAFPSLIYIELAVLWLLKFALRQLPGLPG